VSGDVLTGTEFLGSTNNQALNLRVNNVRAFRLEPNGAAPPNVIGGAPANTVTAGVFGGTIAGGGESVGAENLVTDNHGAVGGGMDNTAGNANVGTTDAPFATVGGGVVNVAGDDFATVGGGIDNQAGHGGTVGGGQGNRASGQFAVVPGGQANVAADFSFAAGRFSVADDSGSFVWTDGNGVTLSSPGPDTFTVRATGGYQFWTNTAHTQGCVISGGSLACTSTREEKEDFAPIDPEAVLDRVVDLPVSTWTFEGDGGVRHVGPTAEDFHAAFGLGSDDRSIATVDADGVALAAIQGLNEKVEAMDARMTAGDPTAAGGLWPAVAVVGLGLGIALVGRRTIGGAWPSS